jgi:chromosome segregation ATPase
MFSSCPRHSLTSSVFSQLLEASEAKARDHQEHEHQLAGELQDLRESQQVLVSQRDHDTVPMDQFFTLQRELDETRHQLETIQQERESRDEDFTSLQQQIGQMSIENEQHSFRVKELEAENQLLHTDLTGRLSQEEDHRNEVKQLHNQLAQLQRLNEQKENSIHRMRKLFSHESLSIPDESAVAPAAASSPPHSPLRSNSKDKDDCDRLIDSMEKKVSLLSLPPSSSLPPRHQMRVQVHNLQSLQDALSEEKQKNQTLLEQKRALRNQLSVIEETRGTELTTQREQLQQTIQTLNREKDSLRGEARELQVQLDAANALVKTLQDQFRAAPPMPMEETATSPPEDFSKIEELTENVKHLEQEVLELTAHNSSLEGAVSQKTKKIEELSHEMDLLRSNATSCTDELNRIHSEALRTEASLEAQLLEKERSYEELNERLLESEEQAERNNQQLKDYLLILNEKDRTNEDLIDQLQEQIETMSAQLDKAKEARLSADAKNFLLSKQLSDAEERIGQLESREELELHETDQEFRILSSKVHLSPHISLFTLLSVSLSVSQLQDRDALLGESEQENHNLRLTIEELESELSHCKEIIENLQHDSEEETVSFKSASRFIQDEALFMQERYETQLSSLRHSVEESCEDYSHRLTVLLKNLTRLSHAHARGGFQLDDARVDLEVLQNENQSLRAQATRLESALKTSQQSCLHFESLVEKIELERSDLKYKLMTLEEGLDDTARGGGGRGGGGEKARHEHESTPAAAVLEGGGGVVSSSSSKTNGVHHSGSNLNHDLFLLTERFDQLEKRAVEMSTQGAKQFARSAKGMALLESENFQLKSLVDHFRLVNAKLLGDIRVASTMSQEENSVIVRYQLLEQELQLSHERVTVLETEIQDKDHQLLKMLESSHLEDERRTENFEEELRFEKERSMSLQEQIHSQQRTLSRLTNLTDSLQKQLEDEMESSLLETESLRKGYENETQRADEAEALVSETQLHVNELEQMKEELESVIESKTKILTDKTEEWQRKKTALEEEGDRLRLRIKEMEIHVEDHKARLRTLEEESLNKETKHEGVKHQLHDTLLELEELEAKFHSVEFTSEQQVLSLQQKDQKITDLTRFLEEARQQVEMRDDDVRLLTTKFNKLEDKMRKIVSERNALETTLDELRMKNDGLADESQLNSSRYHEMQFDLTEARRRVDELEDELLECQTEMNSWKTKNETLSREKSLKEKEMKSLEQTLESLKLKTMRCQELEQALVAREGELEEIKNSKERILMDMQAVVVRYEGVLMSSIPSLPPPHSSNSSTNSHPRHDISDSNLSLHLLQSAPYDLLMTPMKTFPSSSSSAPLGGTATTALTASNTVEVPLPGLSDIRNHFERMVALADEQLARHLQLEDAHSTVHQLLSDSKRGYEALDQKYRSVIAERDAILSTLKSSENELASLTEELENVMTERDNARHVGEDQTQWLRLLRRDLQQMISNEIVTRTSSLALTFLGNDLDESVGDLSQDHSLRIFSHDRSANDSHGALVESPQRSQNHHPLTDQLHEIEAILSRFCHAFQRSKSLVTRYDQTIKKLESQAASTSQRFENERLKMQSRLGDLTAAFEREQTLLHQHKTELMSVETENQKMKNLLGEYSQQNSELQEDLKACVGNNTELKNTLKDAEVLCGDMRGRIKSLVIEKEELSAELMSYHAENSSLQSKITNLEIQVEQWSTDTNRIRTERDALADIRTSLQSQLDAARAEAAFANEKSRQRQSSDDDLRATFELERLLAVFGATLDHLQATLDISTHTTTSPTLLLENGASRSSHVLSAAPGPNKRAATLSSHTTSGYEAELTSSLSVTDRVEYTVRRLTDLRSWSRDDRRVRRQLEDRILSLEQELESLSLSSKLEADELRLSLAEYDEKEKETHQRLVELETLRGQVVRYEEEMSRHRRDKELLLSTLDNDKRSLYTASSTLQNQDFEIQKLQEQREERERATQELQQHLDEFTQQLQTQTLSLEKKDETIRQLKALNSRLQDSVERQEGALEKLRKEKQELEKRVRMTGEEWQGQLESATLHSRGVEKELKESLRQLHELEKKSNEQLSSSTAEITELKLSIHSLESRLQQASAEAASYRKESTSAAQELTRLQNKLEREAAEHSKLVTTVSSLQQLEESWRRRAEGTTVLMEEEENR